MGIEPRRFGDRVFDMSPGRLYFRHWNEQSLHALGRAARGERDREHA
jgi:hypothetical protein